ncbi:MAG: efflux transporter outer membrane subunit [Sulfurifustis sp.]
MKRFSVQRTKKLAWLTVAMALAGCAVGPDYRRPQTPVPETIGAAQNVAEVKLPEWNAYFADKTLQDLISRALEYNRDLRVATARVEEARALYGIQRADLFPSFDVAAQANSARTPASVSITGSSVVARRYDVNLGLLAYELDFWGRVRRLSESALASFYASTEAQRAFRLSLIADVANAYFSLRALDERAEFARRTATTREEGLRVIARRAEAGVASRLDLLQAESALETARADAAALARQAANARHALAVLIGEPINVETPSGATLDDLPLPAPLPAGLSSTVLLNRPDVLSAEQNLVAANANIGAARAAFFPRLTLVGTLGVASNDLSHLFQSGSRAWSFAPSITQPLFEGGRLSAGVDVARARNVAAVAQYERAIQSAFAEVADVLSDQQYLAEQYAAQQRLVERQTERLKLAEARYNAGLIGFLDVLDAQREQYTAQQVLIDVKRARFAAAAQAYKALGGS